MKLENITIENYRQFEKAELNLNDGITILAGANNSGKTSLINLISNVFVGEKNTYNISDIPAKNMKEWIDYVYPIFLVFFISGKNVLDVDNELVEKIIPKDESVPPHLINTTKVKIHVSYNPDKDDIKLFADYIMDLDDDMHDFYFLYNYEITRSRFIKSIIDDFDKLKNRIEEIEEDKRKLSSNPDEDVKDNLLVKERYLKQLIVELYVKSTISVVYYCDKEYINKCKFDDIKDFRGLFKFKFIEASRPLDDNETDHSHMLSKQMIRMAQLDEKWNELIKKLPDELLKPIQNQKIDKAVRATSLQSLKDTINALEQTNGGKSGELMLDMKVTEDDISELLQRITTTTYNVAGYYLGESSQGLGYSNMIYIHLRLKEYEKDIDSLKVNMFFLEEPESHMHPQMQHVFIKYLLNYYQSNLQGLITTHSNEMVRVAGMSTLRVIRSVGEFKSRLLDLSSLLNELKESQEMSDRELVNFFDWFFEIGYSEIVFADKAIFYEGDTERLFIRKAMTLESYQKLSQQYVAFIQVGGAYAMKYKKLIKLLGIKSLIITDIDYEKDKITETEIKSSQTTNATIKDFYKINHPSDEPTVSNLYKWHTSQENVFQDLIYICFQTEKDGYARTLEEAMLNKFFAMNVTTTYKKSEWKTKKTESNLDFSIPLKKDGNKISDNDIVSVRDILNSTSGTKTDFMYSVIMNKYVEKMMPDYIDGGLKWLME